MYSQNDEEQVILEYFGGKVGRFYDIGAWDGKTFSNVRALLERGWSGLMVEPSPTVFVNLLKNVVEFGDRVRLLNAAITVKSGLMDFYEANGDAVGTLDPAHAQKWHLSGTKFVTHTLGMQQLFNEFGRAEFINLDVEGTNATLFPLLPWDWTELRMVCVEHDGHEKQMEQLVMPYGFRRIHRTAENLILVR
jgi:FkbM family methyltransferase